MSLRRSGWGNSDKKSTSATDTVSNESPGSLADLDQYLQRDVSITLKNGRRMEGIIQAIEGDTLKLKRHMHGGTMVVPVQRHEIQAVSRL